jgi:hypothetical protein
MVVARAGPGAKVPIARDVRLGLRRLVSSPLGRLRRVHGGGTAKGHEVTHEVEREMFGRLVGTAANVTAGGRGPVAVRFERIEDYGQDPGRRFSVFLSGDAGSQLPQGSYRVEAGDREPFDLFLVPVARDGDRVSYEAAFNRTEAPPA